MKILFYFGHPAQYLFLRETIRNLVTEKNASIIILIKSKDVLEDLIKTDGFDYKNIHPKIRGNSNFSVFSSFIKRLYAILPILLEEKPDLLVSTDAPTAICGMLLGIHRITITEDDYQIVKNLALLTYPFTETILCPDVCDVGLFKDKKIGYNGFMKLGYLHPKYFTPDPSIFNQFNISTHFVLIRLARLTAHHDYGVKGITLNVLDKLIDFFKKRSLDVLISSEYNLDDKYSINELNIKPSDLHHILAHAVLLISDSQSMSVEAAMLGTPSIRFSSFAGKISVLDELEHKYGLTYGIDPSSPDLLINKANELLNIKDLRSHFAKKKEIMLNDKIDVTRFLNWFLYSYPNSRFLMKSNPLYQSRFK